jgi:hypothetical protein
MNIILCIPIVLQNILVNKNGSLILTNNYNQTVVPLSKKLAKPSPCCINEHGRYRTHGDRATER